MQTKTIHPADLNRGDTVLINGEMHTVGSNTVKVGFFGTLVRGIRMDSIEQVLFPKWYCGKLVAWVPQV
jgi:hypothetical protein